MREHANHTVSAQEMEEQVEYMREVSRHVLHTGHPQTYTIVTYGCQMNAHDSENLAGMLREMSLVAVATREEADVVLFNTCCVRDNAERRALGNVTWLKELKKQRPGLIVGVCGCMMQQQGMAEKILKQYPFVDIAFGTHNLHRFPELFARMLLTKRRVVEVLQDTVGRIAEDLPVQRVNAHFAYINIMYGCNNFCSYCIVPFVRGRERSRDAQSILSEAQALRDAGVQDVMLLGQNVNSYGKDLGEPDTSFPKLLSALDRIGIPRIRFMTSHPKDLSDELIDVMANSQHICHALHLPVQSGSNSILSSMRRMYTREQYLERVAALRASIPDLALTTDLIVAYPGETEQDFEDTLSLIETVRYDAAFTFIYSPRAGTKAADMRERIDSATATARIGRLIAMQKSITFERNAAHIGAVEPVLVEERSKRDPQQVAGKTQYGITVNFPGNENLIGQIIPVHICSAAETTLRGKAFDKASVGVTE